MLTEYISVLYIIFTLKNDVLTLFSRKLIYTVIYTKAIQTVHGYLY